MSNNTNDKKEKESHTQNQTGEHHTKYTKSYTALVDAYTQQLAINAKSKKDLKERFFNVMCTIIFFMIFSFIGTLVFTFDLLFKKNISPTIISGIIPAIISSFVTMLTAILKLPQIIANYLFNKDEDNQMVEIIKSIQRYEIDISESEYAAIKKAEEEKDVIQEKELIKKYPKTLAEMPQEDLENTSEPTEND